MCGVHHWSEEVSGNMSPGEKLGVAMVVGSCMAVPTAFWYWAFFGLNEKFGQAIAMTCMFTLLLGIAVWVYCFDKRDRRERNAS